MPASLFSLVYKNLLKTYKQIALMVINEKQKK